MALPDFVNVDEASGRVWLDIGVTPPGEIDRTPLYRGTGFSEYIWNPFPTVPDAHWYKSPHAQRRDRFGRLNTPVPQGAWAIGFKDQSSHGGLRGAFSNFWRNSGETILTALKFYGTLIAAASGFGIETGFGAGSSSSSTAATSAATSEGASTVELANWTDFGSASDAAVASNTIVSEPSFWDRLTGIGERALEYGVKQAISKEIFGDNQQPVSTQATAGQSPINNALPSRGFADSVPYFKPISDMSPFIWLAAGFGLVLVLILSLSRR